MKLIRDYLAHRSDESRGKYQNSVLMTYGIKQFIEPGIFLLRKVNNKPDTFYSMYCNIFLDVYNIFKNDNLLSAI
jgi:hypothetical protein